MPCPVQKLTVSFNDEMMQSTLLEMVLHESTALIPKPPPSLDIRCDFDRSRRRRCDLTPFKHAPTNAVNERIAHAATCQSHNRRAARLRLQNNSWQAFSSRCEQQNVRSR
jgi:hypothetical protein